jgi:dipeptidyl aminopeptidase/acylaminoacyl peptidase
MTLPYRLLISLVCILILSFGVAWADETMRTMTPLDLTRVQSMSSAKISPDGSLIAAVRSVPRKLFDEDDGKNWAELYIIDVASGGARPFVTGEVTVSGVEWRPDSSAVSFLAKRGEDEYTKLYLISTTGGEAQPIVSVETTIAGYAWSRDGNRVALIAKKPKSQSEEELEEQGFTQRVFEEDIRPLRVWIADIGGAGLPLSLDLEGSAVQVRWSPDGERLAVAMAPRPLVDDRLMFQRVHIVDVATGAIEATVDREGKLGRIEWSPDSRHLAMISGEDLHDPSASSLMVVPATGGSPKNLTRRFKGSVTNFAWLDSGVLLFLADVGVGTELYRVTTAGGPRKPLERFNGPVVYTSMSLADDGRHAALIGNSYSHPGEVFVLDLSNELPPARLTEANPWLAGIRLAPQEVVVHDARDGLELEGILIRPLDGSPMRPAPLVMVVHGGPEGHRRNGWLSRYSAPVQVLAARGYAVFFPNYRGSTGRGVGFSKLGQADAAGAEFDDLIDAVDHLIKIGVADEDRIGVTGGSYGGYATAWLTTRYSERFAAGVMFVGISNKISKFGTTDIPEEETLVHALSYPWEKWEFFLERSPLKYVESGMTPLLIMGGDADPRVSPTQSMEMYRALKTLGKAPVRLVRYKGEGHGNRRAASRYDYQLRLLRWFDHYLKSAGGEPPPYRLDYRSPEHGWEAEETN